MYYRIDSLLVKVICDWRIAKFLAASEYSVLKNQTKEGGFPEHYGIFKYCNNIFACFQIRPDGEKASILCEVHRCLFITEEDETC